MALKRVEIELKNNIVQVTSTFKGKHSGQTVRWGGSLAAFFFLAEAMNEDLFEATLPKVGKTPAPSPKAMHTTNLCLLASLEVSKRIVEGRFAQRITKKVARKLTLLAHEESSGSTEMTDMMLVHDFLPTPEKGADHV